MDITRFQISPYIVLKALTAAKNNTTIVDRYFAKEMKRKRTMGADNLAGRLGLEHAGLLGEGVDTLSGPANQ